MSCLLSFFILTVGVRRVVATGLPFNASNVQACQTYRYDWNTTDKGPFDLIIQPLDLNPLETMKVAAVNTSVFDFPMFYPPGTKVNLTVAYTFNKTIVKSDQFTVQSGGNTSCIVPAVQGASSTSSINQPLSALKWSGKWGPCDTLTIQWSGGVPPYIFAIEADRLLPSLNPVYRTISNLTSASVSFALRMPQLTGFQISVRDATAKYQSAIPNRVQLGSESCLIPSWNVTRPTLSSSPSPTSTHTPFPTANLRPGTGLSSADIGFTMLGVFILIAILLGFYFYKRVLPRKQMQRSPPPYTNKKNGDNDLHEVPPPYEC